MMKFLFRCDSSENIGSGHVMRCLTLAEVLAEKGADVYFVCREHSGNLCDIIDSRGFTVIRLPLPDNITIADDDLYLSWLGVSQEQDADQTIDEINRLGIVPDWIVVDHYALDYRWENALRSFNCRIFAIDDLDNRVHNCDLLLDQNLMEGMDTRYIGKVPEHCRIFLGTKYALLQPVYSQLHSMASPRKAPVQRILIYFGGADSDNLTGRALESFLSLDRPEIEADVILSDSSPHKLAISKLVAGHPNIHLYGNIPTLGHLMVKADLAIGASGATSWERLCTGLPAIVVTLAENQKLVAEYLHEKGLIDWIGFKDDVNADSFKVSLLRIIDNEHITDWSAECMEVCDGLGVFRVCEQLILPF